MNESTQVGTSLPEHDYLNATNVKPIYPSITIPTETPSRITDTLSILGFIIYGLFLIIPVLQLYIGRRYTDNCPVDHHIPHYLVVAGVVGMIAVAVNVLQIVVVDNMFTQRNKQTGKLSHPATHCFITCLGYIINFFLFIWFIVGCIWIFRVKNIVQYDNNEDKNYCHPVLYKFAYWILLFVFIFELLRCCHCFRQIPAEIEQLQQAKILVTPVEP